MMPKFREFYTSESSRLTTYLKTGLFKVSITRFEGAQKLTEALQSLPDKYLCHLSKLESVAFNYSAGLFEI